MKLYRSASSPNLRRVRIFLAEKGLAIPLVAVDLGKGEQHSDAYRAINPRRVRGLIGRPNHVEAAVNANLEKRLPRFVDPHRE